METKPESPWRLRFDLLSARFLLWIAGAGRTGDPTPEAHAYLAHCYVRLSAYHGGHADCAWPRRLWEKANFHFREAGLNPDDGPPTIAMAMPIPKPPIFTNAVARVRTTDNSSDDAA
jgi:hypothetical protein